MEAQLQCVNNTVQDNDNAAQLQKVLQRAMSNFIKLKSDLDKINLFSQTYPEIELDQLIKEREEAREEVELLKKQMEADANKAALERSMLEEEVQKLKDKLNGVTKKLAEERYDKEKFIQMYREKRDTLEREALKKHPVTKNANQTKRNFTKFQQMQKRFNSLKVANKSMHNKLQAELDKQKTLNTELCEEIKDLNSLYENALSRCNSNCNIIKQLKNEKKFMQEKMAMEMEMFKDNVSKKEENYKKEIRELWTQLNTLNGGNPEIEEEAKEEFPEPTVSVWKRILGLRKPKKWKQRKQDDGNEQGLEEE